MTSLNTAISTTLRTAPDAERLLRPPQEPQREQRIEYAPSPEARINALKMDTAIELNRAATPRAVVNQRAAPRYSLREINGLDSDAVVRRLQQVGEDRDKPGWVKFLDLIDAPRNTVARAATSVFLPEAKRAAMERGDFDQFGNVKVYGSDVLRAMGVENRVVNAVGGFFLDVVTDPLSWIGGPIGGLKTVGSKGAIQIGNEGQRALRTGLKAARQGRPVADDATRALFDATLKHGIETKAVSATADVAAQADYVSGVLLGSQGRASKAAERIGLGGLTRGGDLAEDTFKATRVTVGEGAGSYSLYRSPAEVARIEASKNWVAKYTNNRGINLAGGKGGAEIAHIPLTDRTLTVPAFKIPGLGFQPGQRAALQRAFALAGDGKIRGGSAILAASDDAKRASDLAFEAERALEDKVRIDRTIEGIRASGGDPSLLELQSVQLGEQIRNYGKVAPDMAAARVARQNASELREVTDVGDVAAIAELNQITRAETKRVFEASRWADVTNKVARATSDDVSKARAWKEAMAREYAFKEGIDFAEEMTDEVLGIARQDQAWSKLIQQREAFQHARLGSLIQMTEDNLDLADEVAEGFQRHVQAAAEVASLRNESLTRLLDSDSKLIAEAAMQVARVNSREMGYQLFSRLSNALTEKNLIGPAEKVRAVAEWTAKNVGGGERGIVPELMSTFRTAADTGATAQADRAVSDFQRGTGFFEGIAGFDSIAARYKHHYADLSAFVTLRVQDKYRAASGLAQPLLNTTKGSPGRELIERLGRAGITQDKDLVREVDALADRVIDLMQSVRDEAILRGDMDTWADSYLPAMLTNEAGNRVKRLAGTKGGTRDGADVAATLQTQEPRLTNLIEFNSADGGYRSFTILDAKTIGAKRPEDFAEMRARGQIPEAEIARQEQIKASIDEFFAPFGATDPNAREQIMRDRARPLLPFELNELAARGHFDALVGGQLVHQGNMWNTDIMSLLHSRIRADRSQEAIAAFKEAVEPFVLTKIEPREIQGVLGKKAQLANGQEITRIGDNRFQVGDQTYRPIATGTIKADSLFVPEMVYGADVGDLLLPDALATGVERLNDILQPENMGPLFALANTTSSIWKVFTLFHLSWPISNAIGNTVLTAMKLPELLNPREAKSYAGDFKNAMKMIVQRNTGGKRYGSMGTVNVGGQMMSVAQLNREMDAARIVNGGVAGDAQRQMMMSMMKQVPVGSADNPGTMAEKFIARYERNLAEYASMRGDLGDLSKPVNRMTQLRAGLGAAQQGTVDKMLRGWFGANGAIDDVYRTAMYLNLRGKGFDAASAGQQTRQALLNFGDMTSFERNKVRPLVPFYSWMRASLPNMMMRTLRDPKQIAVVPKLTEAMEELLAGEGQVPRHMRPRWLQETMAIQIGSDPETARSFQFGTLVPQEAAGQAISGLLGVGGLAGFNGGDVLDAMNWVGGQFGPPVKIPMELATSREAFTGRSIGAEEGDGDITMNQYLAGQIRPFRELGVGNPNPGGLQRAFGEGIGTGIGRLALGGRLGQNMDTESRQMALSFEMRDKETEIRKAIGRADRRGDQAGGVELRTRLLELYANHIRRGGRPEDVPKWARDDIAGLEAGGF